MDAKMQDDEQLDETIATMDANVQDDEQVDFEDIGYPLYPSESRRLEGIPLKHLKLTWYKDDIWHVVKILGYIGFRQDMDEANPVIPVNRLEMEAAWVKLLYKKYKNYNPTERAREDGHQAMSQIARWKRMLLYHAVSQKRGHQNDGRETQEDIDRYWAQKAVVYPGLEIDDYPPDSDNDRPAQRGYDRGDSVSDGSSLDEMIARDEERAAAKAEVEEEMRARMEQMGVDDEMDTT